MIKDCSSQAIMAVESRKNNGKYSQVSWRRADDL